MTEIVRHHCGSPTRALARQRGFSLLEVMVAFAILSLSLGVLMQIFSRSMNATALSSEYSNAVAVAEARLNAVGVDIPLVEGHYSGDPELGVNWSVDIAAYQSPEAPAGSLSLQPYLVTATASWAGGSRDRQIVLQTVRLGPGS